MISWHHKECWIWRATFLIVFVWTYFALAAVNVCGASTNTEALGNPQQNHLWFDGSYWACFFHPSGASEVPDVAYADRSDNNFGTPHNLPNQVATDLGSEFDAWYSSRNVGQFLTYVAENNAFEGALVQKTDTSLNSSVGTQTGAPDIDGLAVNVMFDADNWPWVCGTADSVTGMNNELQVVKGTFRRRPDDGFWEQPKFKFKELNPEYGACQMVPYLNGDVGFFYSHGATITADASLYYRHYDFDRETWSREVTILSSGLTSHLPWRAGLFFNQTPHVAYKDTSDDLQQKIGTATTENQYSITENGNPTYTASGCPISSCADGDGTGDYWVIGGNDQFKYMDGGTVECWINPDAININSAIFGAYPTTETVAGKLLVIYIEADNDIRVLHRNNTANVLNMETPPGQEIVNNTTYHIVYTVGPSGNEFYKNGTKIAMSYSTGSVSTSAFFNDIETNAGEQNYAWGSRRYNGSFGLYFNGKMENCALWNKHFEQADVDARYNSGSGVELDGTEKGMVSGVPFDGNSSPISTTNRTMSFGTATLISNTVSGTNNDIYFSSCTDLTRAEAAYYFVYDGTDIDSIEWNGTSMQTPVQRVASPTLLNSRMSANFWDIEKCGLSYHADDTTDEVRFVSFNLGTVPERGADGTLVNKLAHNFNATERLSNHMVTFNDTLSFISWFGRDHRVYSTVYDHSTDTFTHTATEMGPHRYWDHHNSITSFFDSSGFVYIAMGGRDVGTTTRYVLIYKSDCAITNASFSLDIADATCGWTDVSPTTLTGRGYKSIVVDSGGVIYLFHSLSNTNISLYERRGGTWSAAHTLVELVGVSNPTVYWGGVKLGSEATCHGITSQECIHMTWSWNDDEHPTLFDGNILHEEMNYASIAPQQDGTFKRYKADATEMTGNMTESNRDVIYNSDPSGDWIMIQDVNNMGLIDNTTPFITNARASTASPYALTGVWFSYWDGDSWEHVEIDSTDANFPTYTLLEAVLTPSDGKIWVASMSKFSGVFQTAFYTSDDNGLTWSAREQITTSSYDSAQPEITKRSSSEVNVLWHERIHQVFGELRFDALQIEPGSPVPFFLRQMREHF